MIDYHAAQAIIDGLAVERAPETVAPAEAVGRVLAEPVRLERDQPPFDRATMDGYAVRLDGARDRFAVTGALFAGDDREHAPEPGQAVRITTGAPCPPGCTVVPVERTDGGSDAVTIEPAALAPARNVCPRGEDGRAGDVVVAAGTLCTPAIVAAVAMAGARAVRVHPRVRLGVLVTGDELDGGGAGIADSNGPLLAALAAHLGLPAAVRRAGDTRAALDAALDGLADADVIVTSGGVSVGERDLVPAAAAAAGFRILFHRVAIQPGKPVLLARAQGGRCLLGLPGNPVSVLAGAHLFLLPLLGRFWGGWRPRWLAPPLLRSQVNDAPRHRFVPARWAAGGVVPVPWHGSGDLPAAASADGLLHLPPHAALPARTPAPFLPFLGAAGGEHGVLPARRRGGAACGA